MIMEFFLELLRFCVICLCVAGTSMLLTVVGALIYVTATSIYDWFSDKFDI